MKGQRCWGLLLSPCDDTLKQICISFAFLASKLMWLWNKSQRGDCCWDFGFSQTFADENNNNSWMEASEGTPNVSRTRFLLPPCCSPSPLVQHFSSVDNLWKELPPGTRRPSPSPCVYDLSWQHENTSFLTSLFHRCQHEPPSESPFSFTVLADEGKKQNPSHSHL